MKEIDEPCGDLEEGEMERCPVCDVPVKCRNMERHLLEQHNTGIKRPAERVSAPWMVIGAIMIGIVLVSAAVVLWEEEGSSNNPGDWVDHHTVLCEMVSATWCPPCVLAEETMMGIFESGAHDMVYLTVLDDVTADGHERRIEHGVTAYPTAVFDGGVKREVGVKGESTYVGDIEHCGDRFVPSVALNVTLDSVSSTGVTGSIDVEFKGSGVFQGRVIVYVVERVSRYDNTDGDPIPNAVLAFERDVDIQIQITINEVRKCQGVTTDI